MNHISQYKNGVVVIALGILIFGVPLLFDEPEKENAKVLPSETPQTSAQRIYASCKSSGGDEDCYSKEFTPLAEERGPNYAFETLFVLQQKDPAATGCHLIAHGIGLGTYLHDPSNWQKSIQNINPACSYGAIHGVLENYVATLPGGKLPKDLVPDICGDNPRADCNHIVGHLILVEAEADVDRGLDICDIFKNNPGQLEHCYTGIFMEFQTALNLIEHGLAPESWRNWPARVDELEKMCLEYESDKAVACWKEIVHAAAVKYKNNAAQVFALCDSAPIDKASYQCKTHSVGIMAAVYNFDYARSRSICEAKQKDPVFVKDCYVMLASSTLSTINTPQTRQATREFCISLMEEYKDPCLGMLSYFEQGSQSQFYMETN
jgi:hypothetical protein